MDVESASALLMLIGTVVTIAFVASAETAIALSNRGQVQKYVEQGVKRAKAWETLLDRSEQFLVSLLLLRSAAYVVGGAVALWWLALVNSQAHFSLLLGLTATWLGLVLVQIISRALTLRQPQRMALLLAPATQVVTTFLLPLSLPLQWIRTRLSGPENVVDEDILLSENGLRFLLRLGEDQGSIEDEEKQMIASIFELAETTVREIMVPRLDVVAVSADAPMTQALDLVIKKGHSRIPVYEESIDHIIGFLYAKDLLRCFRDSQIDVPIRQILRKATFVPQSKKLDELFQEMQRRRVHAAVVVDEYGGTAGLVTIEDLLEEIVGEIQDEYDAEEPIYQQLGAQTYIFNARIALDEVSELLDVDLTEEYDSVDTLGGFIYSYLGRVPEQGEVLSYADHRFTVLSIDAHRIEQVRVERLIPFPRTGGETRPTLEGMLSGTEGQDRADDRFLSFT